MLRHCRKEQPVWPWLNIVLLGVLWGLWGLRGREWVTVQVPSDDAGPVRHRTCQRLKATTLGAHQCRDRSPALQPPAVVGLVASLSHEPQEGHEPGLSHPCATAQPTPHMCGEGAPCRAPMALGGLP